MEGAGPEETLQPAPPPLLLACSSSSSPELNLQRERRVEETLARALGSVEGATVEEEEVMALSGAGAGKEEEEVGACAVEELCEECKLSLGSPTPCLTLLSLTVGC